MAAIERGGLASFYLNGAYYQAKVIGNVKLGYPKRVPIMATDGTTAGFSTEPSAPEVQLTLLDGPNVSLTDLRLAVGRTLQIKMNNGKTYLLRNSFMTEDPSIKPGSGEIDGAQFSGDAPMQEVA